MSSPKSINDSSFVGIPTSPMRMSNLDDNTSFSSLPPSPEKASWRSSYSCDLGTEPTTPTTYFDAKSNLDEFEFDTSRRFFIKDCDFETSLRPENMTEPQKKVSVPHMAFADDLFCDGMVMPLKPPPCFLYPNDQKSGGLRSTPVSPRSPNSLLKIPFQRRSLWNDDFDPFVAALENVKLERQGNSCQGKNRRRAWSVSPLRSSDGFMGCNHVHDGCKQSELSPMKHQVEPIGPHSSWFPYSNKEGPLEMSSKDIHKSPMILPKPKGVDFARRARMVKMDDELPKESKIETGGNTKEAPKEKKRKIKIKKLLRKSYSMIKQTDEKMELPKSKNMRKMSFKSLGSTQPNNNEKGMVQVTKTTLVQYKPKLLLCMGLGEKYVQ